MLRLLNKLSGGRGGKAAFCTAVVAAAGASDRMGGLDKLFMELGGKPVLAHTLLALDGCADISEIIVVAHKSRLEAVAQLCREHRITKISKVVAGGQTRLESVFNGAMQAAPKARLIAVHDGARPFITGPVVAEAVREALRCGAAAPSVPVIPTVKEAEGGMVVRTLDRRRLAEVQTPQVFDAALIKAALKNALDKELYITDDCMAVEALGAPVRLTAGDRDNMKLTTPGDMDTAQAIWDRKRSGQP